MLSKGECKHTHNIPDMMAPSIGKQDNQHSRGHKESRTSEKVNQLFYGSASGEWMIDYPCSVMGDAV